MATLAIFEQDDVLRTNREKAAYLNRQLAAWQELPVRHLRNIGMIWAFEVEARQPNFARRLYQSALARGLLLRPINNTAYFMPPYVIDEAEMTWLADQAAELIKECA